MSDTEDDDYTLAAYKPPHIKYHGYHFGPKSQDAHGCVNVKVYQKELDRCLASDDQDWNHALASTLMNMLHERHDGAYGAEWDYGKYCIHAYCWCEREDCEWCEGTRPYFIDKASGLSFIWYKHANRGFAASREYTQSEIRRMAADYGIDLESKDRP